MPMKTKVVATFFFVVLELLIVSCTTIADEVEKYKPQWNVGDEWYVECRTMPQPRAVPRELESKYPPVHGMHFVVRFQVVGIVQQDEVPCFHITLDHVITGEQPNLGAEHLNLFFRESDASLVHVDIYRGSNIVAARLNIYDWPCFADAGWSGPPLDWPAFTAASAGGQDAPSQDTTVIAPASTQLSNHRFRRAEFPHTGRITGNDEYLSIRLTSEVRGSETVQEWTQGAPWWKSAKQYSIGADGKRGLKSECVLRTWEEIHNAIKKTSAQPAP